MRSPLLYFAGERLSSAELSAACLDGDLVEVGDAYMPADAVETAALRAGSLAPLLGENLAAVHLSAAWVYGVLHSPPPRHTVQRAVPHRVHHVIDRRLVYRDPALPESDVVLIGGERITTRARTIADLARLPDPRGRLVAAAWARDDPLVAAQGRQWLARRQRIPHRRAAEAVLADQEDVTR